MSTATENARPGSAGWWGAPHAPPGAVEGYPAQPSLVPGDTLGLCVSTHPQARYRTEVYRLGWYDGAGGRRISTLPGNVGMARHAPHHDIATGMVRAGWPVTDVIQSTEDWVSGQYVAVLELTSGPHAGSAARVAFVVRALPGSSAPLLVQTPINTAQAYNNWGGKSLYESGSSDGVPAVKVSYDRPYPAFPVANLNARAPFVYELPLIRWLEREGFELAYQTDVDTHRDPSSLLGPRLLVSAGHDEYWTREMRDGFEDALSRGVHLAFMGANTCYWQIRHEDGERTIVEYRDNHTDPEPDRGLKTVRFRDLAAPRPERRLIGQQYEGGLGSPGTPKPFRFVPGFAFDRWAAGVKLEPERPLERLVGYEWDTYAPDPAVTGAVAILYCDETEVAADCTRWSAASGAVVFSAGSLQLPWGLDDWASPGTNDARLQQILRAGFAELLA